MIVFKKVKGMEKMPSAPKKALEKFMVRSGYWLTAASELFGA